jgi:hypothetical protein
MKQLLPILSLALILFSCKKSNQSENKPEPEAKKYDVTFNLEGFAQTTTTFSVPANKQTQAVGDTLKNYADNLYYRVLDLDGKVIKEIDQSNTLSSFGTITDQLQAGRYKISFVASRGKLNWSNISNAYGNSSYFTPSGPWNDTFGKQLDLTVSSSAVNQSVRLDRMVGGLEINISDVIPANVARISVTYYNDYPRIDLSTFMPSGIPGGQVDIVAIDPATVGTRLKKLFYYIAKNDGPITVDIKAYDSANNQLAAKTATVSIPKNQKVILTGYLFAPTSSGFSVVVNPSWNASGAPITF